VYAVKFIPLMMWDPSLYESESTSDDDVSLCDVWYAIKISKNGLESPELVEEFLAEKFHSSAKEYVRNKMQYYGVKGDVFQVKLANQDYPNISKIVDVTL
jgi:hypothetical protein